MLEAAISAWDLFCVKAKRKTNYDTFADMSCVCVCVYECCAHLCLHFVHVPQFGLMIRVQLENI